MADRIQHRRDNLADWQSANPILLDGEIAFISDNPSQYKLGDGVHSFNDLPLRGWDGTLTTTQGISEVSVISQLGVTKMSMFDISLFNTPLGGQSPKYQNLEDALGPQGNNIPDQLKTGGLLGVKFLNLEDKYEYHILTSKNWSIDQTDWYTIPSSESNPEFLEAHISLDKKLLWAVRRDGDFYFGAGVPSQIVNFFQVKFDALQEKVDALQQELQKLLLEN